MQSRRARAGFTLVEMLTVIGIIAILAAMLLPVLAAARAHALKVQARLEISQIAAAIEKYDSDYGRFPVSTNAQDNANPDFTYGGTLYDAAHNPGGTVFTTPTSAVTMTNEEVIAILMDMTNYPNGSGPTANMNYVKNPQQTIFLNAKMSGDTSSPGVGTDLVYRDPWGNPYIISMDLNYDELCEDAFYESTTVSAGGLNGLITAPDTNYAYRGKVMVWSAGPDGKIDPTVLANQGANKDNILSWK